MSEPPIHRPYPGSAPAHLVRPDGRVQVGIGPGAWLVDGWAPASASDRDPSTAVVRGLTGALETVPASRTGLRPWTVSGGDALAEELRRRLRAADPLGSVEAGSPTGDGAVVLVSPYLVPVGAVGRSDLLGRSVLPVVAQTARVVVGPWSGEPHGPCLHCLDLHRRDRDAQWPALAAALDDPLTGLAPPAHPVHVLELVGAAVVVLVTAWSRGERVDTGVGYEFGPGAPHVVTRRWSVHPACAWHRPGGR